MSTFLINGYHLFAASLGENSTAHLVLAAFLDYYNETNPGCKANVNHMPNPLVQVYAHAVIAEEDVAC